MRKPKFGSIYLRGNIYWIKYYKDGKPLYESSESTEAGAAEDLLKQRQAEIYAGTHLDNQARRLRIASLLDSLEVDYKVNGKDYEWVERVFRKHVRPYFGEMRAVSFKRDNAVRYMEKRMGEKAKNSTINRELSLLHRAFTLGHESGVLATVPLFPKKLKENNVRKGFFEHDHFVAVRAALPDDIKPVITFAYWTGCRKGEILALQWSQVDLTERFVRLEPGETKNDEARSIPLSDELYEMLKLQRAARDAEWPQCPWAFSRHGKRVKDFRGAWEKACTAAGLVNESGSPARLFHDLRRTGVRNLVRAGVPERIAMAISGHKTRSVFDRYNIVSERDLRDAAHRLSGYIQERESKGSGDNAVTLPKTDASGKEKPTAGKLLN